MTKQPLPRLPEALRLFTLCEAMNWAHLPHDGGIYDQHPLLLERWETIFQMRHEHDEHVKSQEKRDKDRKQRQARP